MSRIKAEKLLAALLSVLFFLSPGAKASEQQDIIDAAQLTPQQINYRTTAVERGCFVKQTNASASEYYPLTYNIRFDQGNAKFIEYTVKRGDVVKAGDVLARFTITGSDVEFTRMELNLQRTEEDTEKGILERQQAIRKKRAEISAEKDPYQKEMLELALRKLEIELERFEYRQQYSIEQQRKAYEKEKTRRETNVLISPVDGIVTELNYKKVDDAVSTSETLVVISSEEILLLRAKNDSGGLRYNMPVKVLIGNNKNQVTLTGRIVAADDAIPEEERTGYAFIELDPYDKENQKIRSPKIVAESIRLDDVLMIQRTAMTLEAGKYFVTKLTDGMVQKRYIEAAINNTQSVWVLSGVEEGETLILD